MLIRYTKVFFIFYFLFQLVVKRKALKTVSVNGKSLLDAIFGKKAFGWKDFML